MKKNASPVTPCESAAIRIQHWFGKDKDNLLQLKNSLPKFQDFCKKYKCDLVRTPRIPSQVEHLPLHGYVLSKKKKQVKQRHVTKENSPRSLRFVVDQSHCSVNQKNRIPFYRETSLSATRVVPCCLKEHFLVSKRLKHLLKQRSVGPKRHDVMPIQSLIQKNSDHYSHLQEWAKTKEERHFHMDRVIKYLTD